MLGVAVDQIPAYVRSLTPTVLLYDTRVTNHGFSNGRATTLQSVLQAGTAMLVDAAGNPVVRCRCGNPLRPPVAVSQPVAVGTPWPGFDAGVLVSVSNGVTVTVTITGVPASTASTMVAPTTAAPSTTAASGGDLTDLDREAAAGLIAAVSECGAGPVTLVDVVPLEGFTGSFTITLDVGGTQMLFLYEPDTGTITEGDRASADLIASCGIQ